MAKRRADEKVASQVPPNSVNTWLQKYKRAQLVGEGHCLADRVGLVFLSQSALFKQHLVVGPRIELSHARCRPDCGPRRGPGLSGRGLLGGAHEDAVEVALLDEPLELQHKDWPPVVQTRHVRVVAAKKERGRREDQPTGTTAPPIFTAPLLWQLGEIAVLGFVGHL